MSLNLGSGVIVLKNGGQEGFFCKICVVCFFSLTSDTLLGNRIPSVLAFPLPFSVWNPTLGQFFMLSCLAAVVLVLRKVLLLTGNYYNRLSCHHLAFDQSFSKLVNPELIYFELAMEPYNNVHSLDTQ